jgi:hypothetical protein
MEIAFTLKAQSNRNPMQKLATIFLLLFLSFTQQSSACSMYKVTVDGKTMVGNNEDSWRTTPHIWFETGKNGSYGCCFVGSRSIGNNRFAAQSGMNEHGLAFSRLSSYHPIQTNDEKSLKLIENADLFLMEVMHSCKSVDEVEAMLAQYDRSCFIGDVFVYVEPSGKYLIVEPYNLIHGTDPYYVQSNYCPSITSETERRMQERYRKGSDLLSKEIGTSWEFCTRLSQEMHVSRDKISDGTLLTTIWSTEDLNFKLFFYHDFTSSISFDLMEELAKGDHQVGIESMFPENEDFTKLKEYITPFNTPWLRVVITSFGGFFLLSGFIFMIGVLSAKRKKRHGSSLFLLFLVLFLSFCYMFVLASTQEIFYFPAPYKSPVSNTITVGAYFPYIIIFLILVIIYLFWRKSALRNWNVLSKILLSLNAFALACVIFGLFYWKLL